MQEKSRFLGDCSRESFRIMLEQEARFLEVPFSKNALSLVTLSWNYMQALAPS